MSFITNSLGSIGSIAGSILGGPIGGAIGGAAGGMLTNAIDGGGGSSGGSSGTPTQQPYSAQNALANLAQEVGPASAAMQVANQNEQLANTLQNNALTSEGTQTGNAQNSLRSLYSQVPNPLGQSYNVSQVAPQSLSSVMGPGQGQLPQIYSPQPTPYATQVATMTAAPGGQQQPIAPQQSITTPGSGVGANSPEFLGWVANQNGKVSASDPSALAYFNSLPSTTAQAAAWAPNQTGTYATPGNAQPAGGAAPPVAPPVVPPAMPPNAGTTAPTTGRATPQSTPVLGGFKSLYGKAA